MKTSETIEEETKIHDQKILLIENKHDSIEIHGGGTDQLDDNEPESNNDFY
jgi:hypothetical protein